MNGIIKQLPVNSNLFFYSDLYAERINNEYDRIKENLCKLIDESNAVMFTWKPDTATTIKLVFFPFEEQNGSVRAATIINSVPYSHTNSVFEAVRQVVYATGYSVVYYKVC